MNKITPNPGGSAAVECAPTEEDFNGIDPIFTDNGKAIQVAGKSIAEAVSIAGGTPCYVYSREVMQGQVAKLRAVLPDSIKLLYSIKANPNPLVVATLASCVDGFDVTSQDELRIAIGAGVGKTIQFSGPGKSRSDIETALAADAVLNVESSLQFEHVLEASRALNKSPRICIRVNPSFLPGGAGLRMTGKPSQFGVFANDIEDLLAAMEVEGIAPIGFHFYWGTQLLNGATIGEIQLAIWDMAKSWIEKFGLPIHHLNLGGGIGIPYHKGDSDADLAPIGAALEQIVSEYALIRPDGRICLELGRYFVGPSGVYVTSVLDKKSYDTETFVVTDGGLHHNLAATGNFGQGLHRPFPCLVPDALRDAPRETITLTGCLCTPMDVFARHLSLPVLNIGDLIGIFQTGAYGLSASPNGFLSHKQANEIVL